MHVALDDGGVLCTFESRRAFVVEDPEPGVVREAVEPVNRIETAQRRVRVLLDALNHHDEQHDSPAEVDGPSGWVDVRDLVAPLAQALGVEP